MGKKAIMPRSLDLVKGHIMVRFSSRTLLGPLARHILLYHWLFLTALGRTLVDVAACVVPVFFLSAPYALHLSSHTCIHKALASRARRELCWDQRLGKRAFIDNHL